jgi:hypothetical protein
MLPHDTVLAHLAKHNDQMKDDEDVLDDDWAPQLRDYEDDDD